MYSEFQSDIRKDTTTFRCAVVTEVQLNKIFFCNAALDEFHETSAGNSANAAIRSMRPFAAEGAVGSGGNTEGGRGCCGSACTGSVLVNILKDYTLYGNNNEDICVYLYVVATWAPSLPLTGLIRQHSDCTAVQCHVSGGHFCQMPMNIHPWK